MRTTARLLTAALCTIAVAGCSTKPKATPSATTASVTEDGKDRVERTNVVTVTAVVQAIDQKTRHVTLLGPDGDVVTIKVGDDVRNLAQVKKGDQVQVSYYESLAFQLRKPGEAKPGVTASDDMVRAEPGQKPGGAVASAVTVTTTVEKINKTKQTITLKGPDGNLTTVDVQNPANLEKVKVGDLIEITYTEALGISVEKPTAR